jgi:hypothetical protein
MGRERVVVASESDELEQTLPDRPPKRSNASDSKMTATLLPRRVTEIGSPDRRDST